MREYDSEPCTDQARRMARLGFDLLPTEDTAMAVWRRGPFELMLPANRKFESDAELCGVIVEKAIEAGAKAKQDAFRRVLGLSVHS